MFPHLKPLLRSLNFYLFNIFFKLSNAICNEYCTALKDVLSLSAICMLKENDIEDFNMDFVYDCIAQKNRVSTRKVKWNIEKSINSMFRYSNNSKILSIFPEYDGRKPTPKYAIGLALNRLKDFD